MYRACLVAVLLAGRSAGADCTVAGTLTLGKVTVKTASDSFEVGLYNTTAAVMVSGRTRTVAVSDAIAFTGTVSQQLWLAIKDRYVDGQITFERGSNFIVERADSDMLTGRAVLHASDVMEGEDKDPDEAAGVAHVPCSHVALEWGEHTEASVAGTGTYYHVRHGSSLLLHRAPKDGASGITVAAPNCTFEGCMFVEGVASKPGWVEVAAVNEGVAAVGWVRAGSLHRIPDNEGVGYSYGCTGDHDTGQVMRINGPNVTAHTVKIVVGTGLFTGPRGEAWAIVKRPATFTVLYAPGDTWAEVTGIEGVNLRDASAYVPVASLRP